MDLFTKHPPSGVSIVRDPPERCIVSTSRVRICFVVEAAMELTLNLDLHSFVMEFTFKTNREGLLLGCIGNINLWSRGLLPHMRFLPAVFMIADEEDEEAHAMLLDVFFELLGDKASQITDGFLDKKCWIGGCLLALHTYIMVLPIDLLQYMVVQFTDPATWFQE
jgi:hypothetical protein